MKVKIIKIVFLISAVGAFISLIRTFTDSKSAYDVFGFITNVWIYRINQLLLIFLFIKIYFKLRDE